MSSRSVLLIALALCPLIAPHAAAQFGGGPDIAAEVIASSDAAPAGASHRMALRIALPDPWHMNAHEPLEDYLVPTVFTVEPVEGVAFEGAVYPESFEYFLEGSDEPMAVYGGEFHIGFSLAIAPDLAPGEYALSGALRYQACNESQCWMPTTLDVPFTLQVVAPDAPVAPQHPDVFAAIDFAQLTGADDADSAETDAPATTADADWRAAIDGFEVTGRNSGYIRSGAFIDWVRQVESGEASAGLNQFAGIPLWLAVILTLAGGLLLNLTPCVLPMIPINLAIIGAGAQASSRARGFALGGAYGLAIAIVYGVLGLLAALAGTAFGTLNASPWFNLGIAGIFVVLGLAMFDVIMIDLSRFQGAVNVDNKKKGGFILAFFMGGVAALLAGACVGPVVISVILLAQDLYAQGNPLGLALPFLLGVGMALPWPFAGAAVSLLPRPGAWMNKVKYAFGVFILFFAAYYAYEGAALLADRWVDETEVAASVGELDEDGWTTSLVAGLEQARTENKPVFIDFWATWCKNCLTMNKTTFKDPDVAEALSGYVKVKYQAQELDASPAKETLDHLGVGGLGLPVYVILSPPQP